MIWLLDWLESPVWGVLGGIALTILAVMVVGLIAGGALAMIIHELAGRR